MKVCITSFLLWTRSNPLDFTFSKIIPSKALYFAFFFDPFAYFALSQILYCIWSTKYGLEQFFVFFLIPN